MSVSPTGTIGVTVDALARTLAATTQFQTETSSANATAALAHIFYGKASDHIAAQVPPRAIIDGMETRYELDGGISTTGSVSAVIQLLPESSYLQSGTYIIDETKWNDALMDFWNRLDAICREMMVLISTGQYITASGIEIARSGLDCIGEDVSDRKDESNNTLPGKDVFYAELIPTWRGG